MTIHVNTRSYSLVGWPLLGCQLHIHHPDTARIHAQSAEHQDYCCSELALHQLVYSPAGVPPGGPRDPVADVLPGGW